jgi:hypothetical protein
MLTLQHNKVMPHNHQLESSFNKTLKVIESCTTKKQLKGASRMISNFKALYGKVGYVKLLNYKLTKEYNNKKVILWR